MQLEVLQLGYVKVKHIFKQRCFNSKKNVISKFFVMNKSKNNLLTKDLMKIL